MIKNNGLINNARTNQKQSIFKNSAVFCGVALVAALFMAGCQKENSTSTTPQPVITANVTTAAAVAVDVDAKPVNLGTAIDFEILSETGISTTGVTAITGNIGVSPIAATAITGFGLIKDASNQFSTSHLVTGQVFAANYAVPTPAKMTTAMGDMRTAFTNANLRTFPSPLNEKFAGNLSGRNLHPGLYKWSTGVLITSVGVTLTGMADDVWVFQIAKNLTVANSAIIYLAGGAQAKNVFWVVSGKATLGTGVNFKGNILSKTLISVNTGSKVTGRLFAQTAVTLNADAVHP